MDGSREEGVVMFFRDVNLLPICFSVVVVNVFEIEAIVENPAFYTGNIIGNIHGRKLTAATK